MRFADRMDYFKVGIFSKLAVVKSEVIAGGKRVVDLSVGTPNIPPADHVMKVLSEEVLKKENYIYAYAKHITKELLESAAMWYQRRYHVTLDPASEIEILLGSQDGLSHLPLILLNPGDLALVPDPCYPIFADGCRLAGAELYYMPQKPENGWVIDLSAIPEDVARRAKMMIVSYPNNPVTVLAPDSFYRDVTQFAKKYDIVVVHDNAYSELVYDGKTAGSFLSYPGAKEVGIEINSLSKTYGLAGGRIGFALGNAELIGKLYTLKSNIDYGLFLPLQKAAIAALTGPQDSVEATCRAYEKRRNLLSAGLSSIGWAVEPSPATMFIWTALPKGFASSEEFCMRLVREAGVLMTPGSAFGPSGEGYVRIALVQDEEDIDTAVRRIAESGILG